MGIVVFVHKLEGALFGASHVLTLLVLRNKRLPPCGSGFVLPVQSVHTIFLGAFEVEGF